MTLWRALFGLNLVLLALSGVVLPGLEPGTASHSISVLSLGLNVVCLIGLAIVIKSGWNPF